MAKGVALLMTGAVLGASIVYVLMRDGDADSVGQMRVTSLPAQTSPRSTDEVGRVAPPAGVEETTAAGALVATGQTLPTGAAIETVPPVAHDAALPVQLPPGSDPDALIVPVSGIEPSQLFDTYTDARDSGRVHDAIDIMAAAGTPVLAAADGPIEKLFTSDKGGLTIYQFANHGDRGYYYAHLQGYADGLMEKRQVRQGDVIGYVGSTGNANPAAPHLHFEVFVLGSERQWWTTKPLNPYPLLGGR